MYFLKHRDLDVKTEQEVRMHACGQLEVQLEAK